MIWDDLAIGNKFAPCVCVPVEAFMYPETFLARFSVSVKFLFVVRFVGCKRTLPPIDPKYSAACQKTSGT